MRSYIILSIVLAAALLVVPHHAVDPWGLINPYSLIRVIFLLTILQIASAVVMSRYLGQRAGFFFGFFGGLISSTALSATLSKQSHECSEDEVRLLSLSYLSALLGMVTEACVLVFIGLGDLRSGLYWIFVPVILMTCGVLAVRMRSLRDTSFQERAMPTLSIKSLMGLGAVIAIFLVLSKVLQTQFGDIGQYFLTFAICQFELHGSIIANTQLQQSGAISVLTLGNLVALGILSSYLAKMLIVITLGSPSFKRRVIKYTCFLVSSLAVGWGAFRLFFYI